MESVAEFAERVFAAVRRIPRGRVASYGLVAEVAGHPRAARQVGMVMRLGKGIPWWRVVAQDGRIVIADPQWKTEQATRLEAEGVSVRGMRVDYERFAWQPKPSPAPRARPPRSPVPRREPKSPRKRR